MDDKVIYWVEMSDYDIETADAMQATGRYLYVGFMCHQTIEKILKAPDKGILYNVIAGYQRFTTMDKEQAINLARKYKEAVAEKLPLKALYLYGSYSKGTYTEDSDIDIAVVVEHLSDNYFEDTPILWKLRRKVSNLIEPVLLTEDLNNPLYCDVAKTGILIQ